MENTVRRRLQIGPGHSIHGRSRVLPTFTFKIRIARAPNPGEEGPQRVHRPPENTSALKYSTNKETTHSGPRFQHRYALAGVEATFRRRSSSMTMSPMTMPRFRRLAGVMVSVRPETNSWLVG